MDGELYTSLEYVSQRVEDVWGTLRLKQLDEELVSLDTHMQESGFWSDQQRATQVSQRREWIDGFVTSWRQLRADIVEARELGKIISEDVDEQALFEELVASIVQRFSEMEVGLLLGGKYDSGNAYVSVQAGSGGTEAQDWAEMLLRMLTRYAERKKWNVTLLDESRGSEAGYKSVRVRIEGSYAFGLMQSEHGTHRLVRISPFDAEGMRHTSFAFVEVTPEIDEVEIEVDPNDLRIDTFMASGKGGQSVNTTYSAVRIVHIPTNISVSCQNERSQLQNKETAMKILKSKLQQLEDEKQRALKQELGGSHASADWGSQIRSYVLHPYKMVKDVRTKYEESDPETVLAGEIDGFVKSFLTWNKKS